MTSEGDFKRLVRARMEKTGEAYSAARAQLRPQLPAGQDTGETEPEMTASRGPALTVADLIELAEHDVTPEFIAQVRELGLDDLDIGQLIELSEHDVTPEFIAQVRELGLDDLDFGQLIELSERDVTPEFIAQVRELGLDDLDIGQLIELADHDVTPEFIAQVREAWARPARGRFRGTSAPDVPG